MKPLPAILTLAFATGAQCLSGAESTFSLDGRHVYVAAAERPGLEHFDLAGKTRRTIDLSSRVDGRIIAVSTDHSGLLACASADALWLVDPAAATCREIARVPEGCRLVDTAYDPKTGELLVICRQEGQPGQTLLFLPKDGTVFTIIRNRYQTFVACPVFTPEGILYFSSDGDLWHGGISKDEDEPGAPPLGNLDATRCLPLADLVVGNHTPASTGLRPLGPCGEWFYAGFGRMGGSGWDSLVRFKRPVPVEPGAGAGTDQLRWQRLIGLLGSVEVLVEDFECRTICSSRDGRLAFMLRHVADGGPECFLASDGGRPVALEIAGEPGS
jgi:hypothetical protein